MQSAESLDARGYCTRFTLCAYYTTPPYKSYRVTLPPSNYPPTAPYANLSAHFAKLVRAGQLKSHIVKMLLYPQARQSIDIQAIPLRVKRRHKTSAKIAKKQKLGSSMETAVSCTSSERSELERQDAFELPTDSESDENDSICEVESDAEEEEEEFGDCVSDPFEYVNLYAQRHKSNCDSNGTFIDYGSAAGSLRPKRKSSYINLIRLSGGSDEPVSEPVTLKKESLVIGSKALRALARQSTDPQCLIIHTTTAHLELGSDLGTHKCLDPKKLAIQQISENSQGSSVYDGRGLGGVYLACENLADLAEESKIKKSQPESPTERHSLPNMFVGNRFNRSPNTAVYVPSWKDRHEMLNQSVEEKKGSEEATGEEVHASSLDLPAACRLAPDQLQAELLYNFDGSLQALEDTHIIAPPSMFEERGLSLQREVSPFKNHALNSDKRLSSMRFEKKAAADSADIAVACSKSSSELVIEPPKQAQRPTSIQRCISYQYIQMSGDATIPATTTTTRNTTTTDGADGERRQRRRHGQRGEPGKCKCCESSQCPSPRSSDSGMAGSCTIASPDPPQSDTLYYYGGAGALPLDAPLDLTRFDVCGMFREKFLTPEATRDDETENSATTASVPLQVQTRSVVIKTKGETSTNSDEAEAAQSGMFRSGMYAHWWKKEKLPAEVVRGIAVASRCLKPAPPTPQPSKESYCSLCTSNLCSFGEGAAYCALCRDCAASTESPVHTATTNTSSFSCPLCSADDMRLTPAMVTTSSTTSSCSDCPFCSGQQASLSSSEPGAQAQTAEGKQTDFGTPLEQKGRVCLCTFWFLFNSHKKTTTRKQFGQNSRAELLTPRYIPILASISIICLPTIELIYHHHKEEQQTKK